MILTGKMYIYKCKLDGRKTFLIGILKRFKERFLEIETYCSVIRNDKDYPRERWKLLQDALY